MVFLCLLLAPRFCICFLMQKNLELNEQKTPNSDNISTSDFIHHRCCCCQAANNVAYSDARTMTVEKRGTMYAH